MQSNKMQTRNMWRWYCGGGVVAIAVVLGCATAVDFKDSGREAGAKRAAHSTLIKPKRGIAAESGQEPAHNGGKPRMPIEISFDGDPSVTVNQDRDVIIAIIPGADISNASGSIVGLGGLKNQVNAPLGVTSFSAGKSESVVVRVPALSGSLAVTVTGQIAGAWMSETMELQVNPKRFSTQSSRVGVAKSGGISPTQSGDMNRAVERDGGTGQLVEPMTATER